MSNWIETNITVEDCIPGEMCFASFKGSESMKKVKKVQASCWCTDLDWNSRTKILFAKMKAPAIDITKLISVTYEDNSIGILTFIIKLRDVTSI